MARTSLLVATYVGLLLGIQAFAADVQLKERPRLDRATRTRIELKAEGKFRLAAQSKMQDDPKAQEKSLALKVESRYVFVERVLDVKDDVVTRAGRRVIQAVSIVGGEVRPIENAIRPEVMTLVTEPLGTGYESVSPAGPLTRGEIELVQGPGDPLSFPGLLPNKPVSEGDTWRVSDEFARSITGYDTLTSNQIDATLKSIDPDKAELMIKGQVRGSVLGGEGGMGLVGSAVFDRKLEQVVTVRADRAEVREAGPVETGLDIQSRLAIDREPNDIPKEFADGAIAGLPRLAEPGRDLLIFTSPDGTYTMLHDRNWHVASDDIRQVVFKKIERGESVAQANFVVGPKAGKGRHQDIVQFRDDIKKALGARFVSVLGAGELDGAPAGGFRYKVAVQGREGETGVVWYYYLVASPAGDQLLVTFTLAGNRADGFAESDQKLIRSLEWTGKRRN